MNQPDHIGFKSQPKCGMVKTMEAFTEALERFLDHCQAQSNAWFEVHAPNVTPDKYFVERGTKFVRMVAVRAGGAESVFCFVACKDNTTKGLGTVKTGDILKAAGWKQPAKHVRGTIFAQDPKNYGVNQYGANYLR